MSDRRVNGGSSREGRSLVLALGSTLRGDDGVGPAVLAALAKRGPLPTLDLMDGGTPGLETALLMEGYGRVIIIDAANMALPPGTWRRFSPEVVRSGDLHHIGTLHAAGLGEALALGRALNLLPDDIILYGVQPADIGWQDSLSKAVLAAVDDVADAIWQDVQN